MAVAGTLVLAVACSVHADEVKLWGIADGATTYIEQQSDGFFRMDLPDPGTNNQRFHAISNPSVTFGSTSFDGFPNDANFRLGSVTYDESVLTGGTGTAPITDLVLGIGSDPDDASYVNYGRWTDIVTTVNTFSGTVTVDNGQVIAMDLTSDVSIEYPVSTFTLSADGYFNVTGNQFDGYLEGDTWAPGYSAIWDLQGTLTTVPEPASLSLLAIGGVAALSRRRRR
jgi:hypothetical protein